MYIPQNKLVCWCIAARFWEPRWRILARLGTSLLANKTDPIQVTGGAGGLAGPPGVCRV